jgi:hypothetical protein
MALDARHRGKNGETPQSYTPYDDRSLIAFLRLSEVFSFSIRTSFAPRLASFLIGKPNRRNQRAGYYSELLYLTARIVVAIEARTISGPSAMRPAVLQP